MNFVLFTEACCVGDVPIEIVAEKVVMIQRRPSLFLAEGIDTCIEFVGGNTCRVKESIEIVRDKLTRAVQHG